MKKNGGGGRGSGRSIETSFHRATPYIAWENKSCGHSPGGRLDTGRCHRTRVAATATDRVREREDGYQWLHYTIPGGEGGGRGEGAGVCVSKCKRERRDANAKGPHHLERIEEPSNEALGIYIYIRRGISFLEEKREDLGRAWKPTTCMRVTKNDETARVRREEVAACLRCALHPVSSIGLLFDKRFAD